MLEAVSTTQRKRENTKSASVKLKVLDAVSTADYLLKTKLFAVVRDLQGAGGARMITLHTIDDLSSIEIMLEQPHESRLGEWKVTAGLELSMYCKNVDMLSSMHEVLLGTEVNVTEWHDRPWGGQFWVVDKNENLFMLTNTAAA